MWEAAKNIETGIVHAVSLPGGMSPHGFAMDWNLEGTEETVTCKACLKFARRWKRDPGLQAICQTLDNGQVLHESEGYGFSA
jgi:hypothetical protein